MNNKAGLSLAVCDYLIIDFSKKKALAKKYNHKRLKRFFLF
jgi:hypothetical protein